MTEQTIQEFLEYMLVETDKLAMLILKPGTPEYNLQQDMIKNAARYRLSLRDRSGKINNE